MQLVLDTNGLIVRKRNNSFWIMRKQEKRLISPKRISSIAVIADCLISASAIRLAAKHEIPIYFFNGQGKAEARLWASNFGSQALIRKQQAIFGLRPEAKQWVLRLFELKTAHQIECLNALSKYNKKANFRSMLAKGKEEFGHNIHLMKTNSSPSFSGFRQSVMGYEGIMARTYWALISETLAEAWKFNGRSRRPARDAFNAALNYLYGMLYNLTGMAVLAAGLDQFLGVLHTDDFNKQSFVFDIIEPFRPWIDQLLVEMIIKKQILLDDIEEGENLYRISSQGRRKLIYAFNERMEKSRIFQEKRMKTKNHVYRFAGEFAQYLIHIKDQPFHN